jgi:hypothetical protein
MERPRTHDTVTIIAIAVVAAAITDVLHELVGHGGACVLTGAQPILFSTVHFECSTETSFLAAGGTIVNLIAGAVCFVLARATRGPRLRYFLWITMVFNLLDAGGYWLYSGVGNIGDWSYFIHDWHPAWAFRVGLTVLGLVSYYLFVVLSARELRPWLAMEEAERRRRTRKLTFLPYFTNGILLTVAGLFNPIGMMLVAISAMAASFGGTSGLLWMGQLPASQQITSLPDNNVIERSRAWLITALVVGCVFVFLLGRGVRL